MQNIFLLFTSILHFIELGNVGKCFSENWRKKNLKKSEKKSEKDSQNWEQSEAKVTKNKSVTKGLSQGELVSSELSDGGPYFLGASEEWSHTPFDRFYG